tara:strand:- start:1226 stop:2203 length:978 start_codon:yes stop_codon:yes gene_type:complete
MQGFRCHLCLFIIVGFLVSCNSGKKPYFLPSALGESFELVIVKPDNVFKDEFYKKLISFLTIDIGPAPQQENILSITEVNNKTFKGLLRRHKNLLFIIQDDSFGITIKKDLYAKGQLVIIVKCPSYDLLIQKEEQVNHIVKSIKEIEFERWNTGLASSQNKELKTIIKHTHGITLPVPKNFFMAHADSNVTWIRRETNKMSQGIVVLNCENNTFFKGNVSEQEVEVFILNHIDSVVNLHIEGSTQGSFMKTDRDAPRLLTRVNHNKFRLQSMWHMANDFMGGVYLAELLQNERIIYIYLYAPGEEKRIPLLQLESIITSAREVEE